MELLGVPLPDPLTSAGRLARGLGGVAFAGLDRLTGRSSRRAVWTCPGRVYVAAQGVHGPGGAAVARRIERRTRSGTGRLMSRSRASMTRAWVRGMPGSSTRSTWKLSITSAAPPM